MAYLMGIDLGTSSLKTLIISEEGNIKAICSEEYPIEIPMEDFAEQNPENWWKAAVNMIKKALSEAAVAPEDIKCIGFSGQMHGMVLLDKNNSVIRPAIIHCDQRSKTQVSRIYSELSREEYGKVALNPLFPGFQMASLLWIKEKEPESYCNINKVILPKDYIRFRLTGEVATECTDASGTLALDPSKRRWSEWLIEQADLDISFFPFAGESADIAGYVTRETALETGLKEGIPVVYGGADQPMQALGNGVVHPGRLTSTIGTGGQIFTPVDTPIYNPNLNTHTFCNLLPCTWYMMGAMLSAGLSLKWLKDNILQMQDFKAIDDIIEGLPAGNTGVIFLPYLAGERTPHLNSSARGMFFGLSLRHDKANMARAVVEGVTYALKDSMELMKQLGIRVDKIIASGGGARSRLWLQIQADVFGKEVYTTRTIEQACTGAAMLAGIGCGIYGSIEEACEVVVKENEIPVEPQKENIKAYEHYYGIYKKLYVNNKQLFDKLTYKTIE